VGGMVTKLEAAKISVDSGIPCVIASGRTKGLVSRIAMDPCAGGQWTVFVPQKSLPQRQRWIAFGTKPKGQIVVDEGARRALGNKKSLLSVGVMDCRGEFACGEVVGVVDAAGIEFARGKACISSLTLSGVKGKRTEKEVIHCDTIVLL